MKIAIVGSGYVGLVSSACFSEMGNKVTCVDIDAEKIAQLNKGILPIYEPGLESIVVNNCKNGNLIFTTSLEDALRGCEIVFIAVGTPMGEDGSADLTSVLAVAKEIGQIITNSIVVVDKSTVPIGTADIVKATIQAELDVRKIITKFYVVSNPEFLKEGAAVEDFMKPDRVVIGASEDVVFDTMRQLYSPFFRTNDRFVSMDIRSAEMTKYAANAMLATKISFMNEIANICERVGADVNNVRIGIGSDSRIGYSFIYPGCGYGGSCFPKDIKALSKLASDVNYSSELINAVENVNDRQKFVVSNKVINRFGEDLSGFKFAVWGLSFKPETDDMREAPAIYIIKELITRGAKVSTYDPKAIAEAKKHYLKGFDVEYCNSKYEATVNADALLLLTEWKEFRAPDFELLKSHLKSPVIFDGRNQYNAFRLGERGFEYYQIGKI
jgi:UDPglucose 6-dehydrogenase